MVKKSVLTGRVTWPLFPGTKNINQKIHCFLRVLGFYMTRIGDPSNSSDASGIKDPGLQSDP